MTLSGRLLAQGPDATVLLNGNNSVFLKGYTQDDVNNMCVTLGGDGVSYVVDEEMPM